MSIIEEINYFNDHRVRARDRWYSSLDEKRMIAIMDCYGDEGEEIEVKFVWEVCPTCNGKGTHVNPSIDCNGLTAEDFADDPDFAESYIRGDYDVACYDCGGKRVIPVPLDPEIIERIAEHYRIINEDRAERIAEMRLGA